MSGIVYCIEHIDSGKCYVGQALFGLPKRWSQHIGNSKRPRKAYFHRSIARHGAQSFRTSILAEAQSSDELNRLERFWILLLRTFDPKHGYNGTLGGDGVRATEEVKQKLRRPKPPRSAEHCRRISESKKGNVSPRKGYKFTETERLRHGNIRKGQQAWNKGLKGVSVAWNKGLNTPADVRQKQSISAKNRQGRI